MKPLTKFVQAVEDYPCITIPKNDIWNPPTDGNDFHFYMEHRGPWQIITKCRAVAIDEKKRIYGLRNLERPQDGAGCLEGRVSIGGKKYRAFTSDQLVTLEDGKLIKIAILYVCGI